MTRPALCVAAARSFHHQCRAGGVLLAHHHFARRHNHHLRILCPYSVHTPCIHTVHAPLVTPHPFPPSIRHLGACVRRPSSPVLALLSCPTDALPSGPPHHPLSPRPQRAQPPVACLSLPAFPPRPPVLCGLVLLYGVRSTLYIRCLRMYVLRTDALYGERAKKNTKKNTPPTPGPAHRKTSPLTCIYIYLDARLPRQSSCPPLLPFPFQGLGFCQSSTFQHYAHSLPQLPASRH